MRLLRIKQERQRRGWRIDDLAHYSRVSAADISRIESGRMARPYASHIKRLAKALRLHPDELLKEVSEPDELLKEVVGS